MSDNYRLAEHNVEMMLEGVCLPGENGESLVRFVSHDDEDNVVGAYEMLQEKWTASSEPKVIYVTVTAVIPTDEPADGVEVVKSETSTSLDLERNPSAVIAS